MSSAKKKRASVVQRLIPSAMKGNTVATITVYKSDKEECEQLKAEGFTIHHAIQKGGRHGQYSLKVEWTNPTTLDGSAAELLALSEKARSHPMT